MRSEEFQNLQPFDQNIILWEKAIIIGEREDRVYKYILYQLNNFYVEVRLTISNLKEVIRTLSADKQLDPYFNLN
jgi:hypothetical protein